MSVLRIRARRKRKSEANEDTDEEDDVLEEATPLAPEERERESPRMLYLCKKESGECVQEHPCPKPLVSIGRGAHALGLGSVAEKHGRTEPGRFCVGHG